MWLLKFSSRLILFTLALFLGNNTITRTEGTSIKTEGTSVSDNLNSISRISESINSKKEVLIDEEPYIKLSQRILRKQRKILELYEEFTETYRKMMSLGKERLELINTIMDLSNQIQINQERKGLEEKIIKDQDEIEEIMCRFGEILLNLSIKKTEENETREKLFLKINSIKKEKRQIESLEPIKIKLKEKFFIQSEENIQENLQEYLKTDYKEESENKREIEKIIDEIEEINLENLDRGRQLQDFNIIKISKRIGPMLRKIEEQKRKSEKESKKKNANKLDIDEENDEDEVNEEDEDELENKLEKNYEIIKRSVLQANLDSCAGKSHVIENREKILKYLAQILTSKNLLKIAKPEENSLEKKLHEKTSEIQIQEEDLKEEDKSWTDQIMSKFGFERTKADVNKKRRKITSKLLDSSYKIIENNLTLQELTTNFKNYIVKGLRLYTYLNKVIFSQMMNFFMAVGKFMISIKDMTVDLVGSSRIGKWVIERGKQIIEEAKYISRQVANKGLFLANSTKTRVEKLGKIVKTYIYSNNPFTARIAEQTARIAEQAKVIKDPESNTSDYKTVELDKTVELEL